MKLIKVSALFLLAGAAAACSHDISGNQVTLDPLAGLRYVNLVPDTGAVDFRIIDVVSGAPNQVAAAFRTGGSPEGVSTNGFLPLHQPVAAGTRHIRVFMNGGDPSVSSQVVFDTSFTFVSGQNYTFYLYGYATTGSTPAVNAIIANDSIPSLAATKFAVRVLNLASTYAGTPAVPVPANGSGVDVYINEASNAATAVAPAAKAALIANQAFGGLSAYVALDTSLSTSATQVATAYRLYVTANSTTSPAVFQASLPTGAKGTSTVQPIPGTVTPGTAFTVVIVPQSKPLTAAPQTTVAAGVSSNIDSVMRSGDTVTVVRSMGAPSATACGVPAAAGVSLGDVIRVTGLTQPEYNGLQAVGVVVPGVQATNFPTCTTAGANPGNIRARFTYRIIGTPVTPATGAMTYRVTTATNEYTIPTALIMIDQLPPRTAP